MSIKSIIIVILLSGLVCFGVPENLLTQYGTGIAQAQYENSDAQRLVRDLEEALKSGDQERIRLAHQRVNSHQQASQILAQRPALQLQLKTATSPAPAAMAKPAISSPSLEAPRSMASPDIVGRGPGGTGVIVPPKVKEAFNTKAGVAVPESPGASSSGQGSSPYVSPYHLEEVVSGEKFIPISPTGSASGGSSLGERPSIDAIVKHVEQQGPPKPTIDPIKAGIQMPGRGPTYLPSGPPPDKPLGPGSSWSDVMKASQGETDIKPAVMKASQGETDSKPGPKFLPEGSSKLDAALADYADPKNAHIAPPGPFTPEQPRTFGNKGEGPPTSTEIIGRGPGGTGIIVPPGVKEGANTVAGPPVPGPAMNKTALNMEGLASQRAQAMDQTTVQSGQGRLSPPGQAMDQTRLGRLSQPGPAMDKTVKIVPPGVNDAAELNRSDRASDMGVKGPGPADTGAFKPVSDQSPTGRTPLTKGVSSFQAQPTLVEEATGAVRSAGERVTGAVRNTAEGVTEAGRGTVSGIQKADAALGRGLEVGEVPPDASVRSGLNKGAGTVLGAAAVVGTGLAAESIGEKGGTGLQDYQKGRELRERAQTERQAGFEQRAQRLETQADRFQNQGKDKMLEAAKDEGSLVGGIVVGGAIGAAAPVAGTIVGGGTMGYSIGRYAMENTETGRALDKLKEDLDEPGSATDSLYRGWERLKDKAGGLLGGETEDQRKSRISQQLQRNFQDALDDGRLKLQPGVEKDDLMAYLQTANLGKPDVKKGLDDFLVTTPPPPGQIPEKITPADGGPGGTAPVKSVQEQDLENFNNLQALNKIKKDAEEKPPVKPPGVDPEKKQEDPPVVEPEKIPVEPPVDPTKGNTGSDGTNADTTDQVAGADPDLVSQLRKAEKQTGGAQSSGGGSDPGLQMALSTNVTGSVQQNLDQRGQQDTKQTLVSISGTQAERAAASQNQQMVGQSQVQAQGQLTSQAIAVNALEFTTAQQTLQVTRQNSLGNILFGSLMGGLTSGIAIGIDKFAGGVGSGAGQQVSTNWGIQPPPTPPTTVTPTTTGTGSSQTGSTTSASGGSTTISPPAPPPVTGGTKSCRTAGTCSFTKYADANGCCTICGKRVAGK